MKWLHRMLNPHCPDCKAEVEDAKINDTVEALREQLAFERANNKQLLDSFLRQFEPKEVIREEPKENPKPIQTGMSWRVRREMLQDEDRQKARALREQKEQERVARIPTEKLEEELLGDTNASEVSKAI